MIAIEKSTGNALYNGALTFTDGCLHGEGFMDARMTPATCELIASHPEPWIGGGAWRWNGTAFELTAYGVQAMAENQAHGAKSSILNQISTLEASITNRRVREAI